MERILHWLHVIGVSFVYSLQACETERSESTHNQYIYQFKSLQRIFLCFLTTELEVKVLVVIQYSVLVCEGFCGE